MLNVSKRNLSLRIQSLVLIVCFGAYLNARMAPEENPETDTQIQTTETVEEERSNAMNKNKFSPWNWFKHEEPSQNTTLPVSRQAPNSGSMRELHHDIDRFIDDAFRNFGFPSLHLPASLAHASTQTLFNPKMDIKSSDKEYTVDVELPGVNPEQVQLEIVANTLTLKGEKKQELEKQEKDSYRIERSYGSFQRVLTLPEDVDTENIDAGFKNGVLSIRLPRHEVPKPNSRKIDIKKEDRT